MPFLVFEQDPLVRADICETLAEEFADQLIAGFENIKSAWADAVLSDDSYVVVLSGPAAVVMSALEAVGKALPRAKFLIIGDDESAEERADLRYTYLQRPFSSTTLLASIRTVLSDQREDHS